MDVVDCITPKKKKKANFSTNYTYDIPGKVKNIAV
jgi:hypothetical protein